MLLDINGFKLLFKHILYGLLYGLVNISSTRITKFKTIYLKTTSLHQMFWKVNLPSRTLRNEEKWNENDEEDGRIQGSPYNM